MKTISGVVDFAYMDCHRKFASENIELDVNRDRQKASTIVMELAGQSKLRRRIHAASQ